MSNLADHARRELELIDEDPEFTEGIVKVVQAFADMGHSGGSAAVAIPMVNELLKFNNLSPLTNDPHEWMNVSDVTGDNMWQSRRNPEAFSRDGGKTYYLLSESPGDLDKAPRHTAKDVVKLSYG